MKPRSRYIFDTTNSNLRTFRHMRNVINNNGSHRTIDCENCQSTVGVNEPYSHHWLTRPNVLYLPIGLEQKMLMLRLEKAGVEEYLLCDESGVGRTADFLFEAGVEAVPHLLRFLFYRATNLDVNIGLYVNILPSSDRMYFESNKVSIANYMDIDETVDMIFSLLLDKVTNYMVELKDDNQIDCTIKRLKMTVKRHWNNDKMQLPMQFRIRNSEKGNQIIATTEKKHEIDLRFLTTSYLNYRDKRYAHFPSSMVVNLYSLRHCMRTKELYAVPYLLPKSKESHKIPTFLIQHDVCGDFHSMYEIRNIRRFLRQDPTDRTFVCRSCKLEFKERAQLALHRQMNCGRGFMVWQISDKSTEFHENCLVLPKDFFKFAWFGLGRK